MIYVALIVVLSIKKETKFIGAISIVLALLGVVAVSSLGLYAVIVVSLAWISLIGVGARLQIFRPKPGGKKGYFFYSKKELKKELKPKVSVELKKTFTPGVIAFSLGLVPGLVMGWHPLTTIVVGFLFYCVASFIAFICFFFWSAGKIGETLAKGAKIIEEEHKKMQRGKKE